MILTVLFRIVVGLAMAATLVLNSSYAYQRGADWPEKAALILVAVIFDLAKSTLLAAAADLRVRGHLVAAGLMLLLWWPAIAYSTWQSFSYVVTSRAATASTKATASETRERIQARYDRAKAQVALATASETFADSAGCTQARGKAGRQFCDSYRQATAELTAADAALASQSAARADPETALVAELLTVPQTTVEFVITLTPAILLELIGALGFYAITLQRRHAVTKRPETRQEGVAVPAKAAAPAVTKTPPKPVAGTPASPPVAPVAARATRTLQPLA